MELWSLNHWITREVSKKPFKCLLEFIKVGDIQGRNEEFENLSINVHRGLLAVEVGSGLSNLTLTPMQRQMAKPRTSIR